jgi:hypothetical protein
LDFLPKFFGIESNMFFGVVFSAEPNHFKWLGIVWMMRLSPLTAEAILPLQPSITNCIPNGCLGRLFVLVHESPFGP